MDVQKEGGTRFFRAMHDPLRLVAEAFRREPREAQLMTALPVWEWAAANPAYIAAS